MAGRESVNIVDVRTKRRSEKILGASRYALVLSKAWPENLPVRGYACLA
jgi:hypothetical protein